MTSLDHPPAGFSPKMQFTALQDKVLIGSENQDSTSSEVHSNNVITVREQKISELELRYKPKRQTLDQQKSVLVTKDMLHTGSKTPSQAAEQLQITCQFYGSEDHQSSTCPKVEIYQSKKLRTIVFYIFFSY